MGDRRGASSKPPVARRAAEPRPALPGAIRRARPRDLDRLAALWSGVFADHAAFDASFALGRQADSRIRELFAAALRNEDAAILVYEEAGDLDALCVASIGSAPPIRVETRRGEIADLAVRESARRRGIGQALVEAAFEWIRSRGVARVEVHVAARNADAQAFWRGLGFDDLMDVLQRRL